MEMFELRYFLAVAKIENVNRAADVIHVSPGSLSKAIARLEEELQVPLFFKSGRGIKLTPNGILLKEKAAHILQLEEDVRLELTGREIGSLNVFLSSEEILQSSYGIEIVQKIKDLYPQAKVNFLIRTEAIAIEQVLNGESHLALITMQPPEGVVSKVIAHVKFQTCASKRHPLAKKYGASPVPISEVLNYPFVAPDSAILGTILKSTSSDGWRDDKFPRQIKYKVCGLKFMENLIREGLALGYLPNYFVEDADLLPLNVSGCPYSCHQTVRLIAKDPNLLGWLKKFWALR